LSTKAGDGSVKKDAISPHGGTSSSSNQVSIFTCIGLQLLLVILETDLLMFLAVGSAWSLQPRDGLYATTGNISYFNLCP
jgi:hypothetical protein